MADQRTLNLNVAKFKGVEFRIRDEVQDEYGRKIVLHEYPNSNSRLVEDLGLVPRRFSVTAFVHTQFYLDNADFLDQILSEEGPGQLNLPVLGTFNNVYALPFSKSASQTRVGEIEYSLSFVIGRPVAGPIRIPTIIPDVIDKGGIWRDLARIDFSQLWVIAADARNLINSAKDLETLTRNALNTLANYIGVSSYAKVLRVFARIENNPGNLIRSGANLAAAFFDNSDASTGFWSQIALSFENGNGLEGCLAITNTGTGTQLISDDDAIQGSNSVNDTLYDPNIPLWPETTQERIDRNRNRITLVNTFRMAALQVAYEQAVLKEYDTARDVQAVRKKLELAYNRIMNVGMKDEESMQAQQNVKNGFLDLRNAALEVLQAKEQNASTITELLNSANYSAYNLTYQLYAEEFTTEAELLEKSFLIRNLNPDMKNAMSMVKNISVLKQ